MKLAPRIAGLFFVDYREFRADMRSAIRAHQVGKLDDLAAALKSHMRRHAWTGDRQVDLAWLLKLTSARNHDRALKAINRMGNDGPRVWVRLLWGLVSRLFWPTLAVLVGLSIYHMVAK